MPDAVAMLERCFNAQYRGLSDEEREWLDYNATRHPEASPTRIDIMCQRVYPIWSVGPDGFHLISIKLEAPW